MVGRLAAGGSFVAFRGNHRVDNWIDDFQENAGDPDATVFPGCDGCKVSLVFYSVWESVQSDEQEALRDVRPVLNDVIHITGHSLAFAREWHVHPGIAWVRRAAELHLLITTSAKPGFQGGRRALLPPVAHFPLNAPGHVHVDTRSIPPDG